MGRFISSVFAAVIGAAALVTVKPEIFDRVAEFVLRAPWSQLISLRGWLVVIFGIAAMFFLIVGLIRRGLMRRGGVALSLALVLAVVAGLHGATMYHRGIAQSAVLSSDRGITASASGNGAITVMQLNTQGGNVTSSEIADRIVANGVDIVSLVETSTDAGLALADELASRGLTFSEFDNHTSKYAADWGSTVVLVSSSLGGYSQADVPAALANVSVPAVALTSSAGYPDIIALHTQSPSSTEVGAMATWRTQIAAAYGLCSSNPNALLVGDFNSTEDHQLALGVTSCNDALAQAGSGALGTWPSNLPELLSAPIDRVMAPAGYTGDEAAVFTAGNSDHRGVVVRLTKE